MNLINTRPKLEKIWSHYDVDSLYTDFVRTGKKPFTSNQNERELFGRYALSRISVFSTKEFLRLPTDKIA